jgi:hypothetical protein
LAGGEEVAGEGTVLIEQWEQFAAAGAAVVASKVLLCGKAQAAETQDSERHCPLSYSSVHANRQ